MAHDSDDMPLLSAEAACAAFRIWDTFAQVRHDHLRASESSSQADDVHAFLHFVFLCPLPNTCCSKALSIRIACSRLLLPLKVQSVLQVRTMMFASSLLRICNWACLNMHLFLP